MGGRLFPQRARRPFVPNKGDEAGGWLLRSLPMSNLWDAVRPQQTWRTETALRGWGRRTRTQKCRGKISL
jgi:hypothetical protein